MIARESNPSDRLIVALDVATTREALGLVEELDGLVAFFKVGYQLFIAEGMPFVRELLARKRRVFLDLKLDDVEETIRRAVAEIARHEVELLTLHGGPATARSALAGRGEARFPRVLAVTLLSSLGEADLAELQLVGERARFRTLQEYILWRAEQALAAGVDGLIASGESVAQIRGRFGPDPILVTPGIRPGGASTHEHQRHLSPGQAIRAGSDYLVVGRPIRDAPDRRAAARSIIDEIARELAAPV